MDTEVDADEYLHALRDPAFLERVEAAYQGRHAVLDALWWRIHPGVPAPSGVAAPDVRRNELQRAVFSRPADAAAVAAAADELRDLNADLLADGRALDLALDAAWLDAASDGSGGFAADAAAGNGIALEAIAPGVALPRSDRRRPRRPGLIGVLASVAAIALFLVGIGVGTSATVSRQQQALAAAARAAAAVRAKPPAALNIFALRPTELQPDTMMLFFPYVQPDTVHPLPTSYPKSFVARGYEPNSVCLLAALPNNQVLTSCVDISAFPASGVVLQWSDPPILRADGAQMINSHRIVWNRNGTST